MPSPIAHSATGYVISRILLKRESNLGKISPFISMILAIIFANVADVDFVLEFLTGEDYHRGFTHSITFALVFSFSTALIARWLQSTRHFEKSIKERFSFVLIIYASHLLLDFFTSGGSGMRLFWPFSNEYYSSAWSIFPPVHHSLGLFAPAHAVFITFEFVYSIAIYCLFCVWKKNYMKSRKTEIKR